MVTIAYIKRIVHTPSHNPNMLEIKLNDNRIKEEKKAKNRFYPLFVFPIISTNTKKITISFLIEAILI